MGLHDTWRIPALSGQVKQFLELPAMPRIRSQIAKVGHEAIVAEWIRTRGISTSAKICKCDDCKDRSAYFEVAYADHLPSSLC